MSGEPHLCAAVTRKPAQSGSLSAFISFVNAMTCEVSQPMMPTRVSAPAASPATTAAAMMIFFISAPCLLGCF